MVVKGVEKVVKKLKKLRCNGCGEEFQGDSRKNPAEAQQWLKQHEQHAEATDGKRLFSFVDK